MLRKYRCNPDGEVFFLRPDCTLSCLQCGHGMLKRVAPTRLLYKGWKQLTRRLGPAGEAMIEQVLASVEPGVPLTLSGYDVLELPELEDLVAAAARRGHDITLITPGHRLADMRLVERLAPHNPRVVLTCLTIRASTSEALTGRSELPLLIEQALSNLCTCKLRVWVNVVPTALNAGELVEIASWLLQDLGLEGFTLMSFLPDRLRAWHDRQLGRWFADTPTINAQLGRIVRTPGAWQVHLCGLVPCRLDERILESPRVRWIRPPQHRCPLQQSPACARCHWKPQCSFVSRYYHRAHPAEPWDHDRVNRHIEVLKAAVV